MFWSFVYFVPPNLFADCLDRILILGRRHLEHVLRVYCPHYNEHRRHRALDRTPPDVATLRRSTRPDRSRVAAAISSAASSMNTRPPEFANPTRNRRGVSAEDATPLRASVRLKKKGTRRRILEACGDGRFDVRRLRASRRRGLLERTRSHVGSRLSYRLGRQRHGQEDDPRQRPHG